jgi:hypothetical protein
LNGCGIQGDTDGVLIVGADPAGAFYSAGT